MSDKNKLSKAELEKNKTFDENKEFSAKTGRDIKENIGALLVEARKNLDLSISDIAIHLNLSKVIINQLENNQFSGSLPLAFVRGYVISYAMRVGLDITTIKKAFDNEMGEESVSLKRVESLSVFEKNRNNFSSSNISFKLISFLIILVIVFFAGRAGWYKYKSLSFSDNTQLDNKTGTLVLNPNLTPSEGSLNIETVSEESEVSENTNNTKTKDDIAFESEVPNSFVNDNELARDENIGSSSSIPAISSSRLEINDELGNSSAELSVPLESMILSFSADCWVQIIDASGTELAFGIKKAGKIMNLQGVPPISVILGDPSVVELIYKGHSFELNQYSAKRRAKITLQ